MHRSKKSRAILGACSAAALAIAGCSVHAELETRASMPSRELDPALVIAPASADSAEAQASAAAEAPKEVSARQTRLRFDRGSYKPGIERLRVVKREDTFNNVAAQVFLSVAASALTGGVGIGAQGFSKDQLFRLPPALRHRDLDGNECRAMAALRCS